MGNFSWLSCQWCNLLSLFLSCRTKTETESLRSGVNGPGTKPPCHCDGAIDYCNSKTHLRYFIFLNFILFLKDFLSTSRTSRLFPFNVLLWRNRGFSNGVEATLKSRNGPTIIKEPQSREGRFTVSFKDFGYCFLQVQGTNGTWSTKKIKIKKNNPHLSFINL